MFVEDVKGPAVTKLSAIYKLLVLTVTRQKCMAHKSQEIYQPKSRLPQFHYFDVFATRAPLYKTEDGNTRSSDEYRTRAQIK